MVKLARASSTPGVSSWTIETGSPVSRDNPFTSPITIDAGQLTSAPVQLQGVGAGSATITANIQGDAAMVVGTVEVLTPDALPDVAAIDPMTASVQLGATQTFTVTLTHPAPAMGETPLTLSYRISRSNSATSGAEHGH